MQSAISVQEVLEQAVNLVTNDNLDLGCAVIEKAATEKVSCNFFIVTLFAVPWSLLRCLHVLFPEIILGAYMHLLKALLIW